jgi:hypothetical protein
MSAISELCEVACPRSEEGVTAPIQFYIGVMLFAISETMSYLNIESNGILQLVMSVLKRDTQGDIKHE